MTAREIVRLIGRKGLLRVDELTVEVEVRDARENYGRTDYLVVPAAGTGSQWVSAERVTLEKED